jgi:hypothetical protein
MRGFIVLSVKVMSGFSWNNLRYSKYERRAFKLYTFYNRTDTFRK